ncbi:MAG: hypothetical protein MUF15_25865, partial [Acidobacteria bacterium]|nr:hypothetical protein [Acidobacteriota bacterium]
MKINPKCWIRVILYFILVSLSCLYIYAETGSPFIRNYSPKEYNAHSQNWSVIQDNRGVMYFGNVDGVLEFDGYNWRLIRLPNFSMVRSMAIDKNGTIYVGGVGELGYLAANTKGEMDYISLLPLLDKKQSLPSDIWSILVTGQGIYFKTISNFLRYENGKIEVIPAFSRALGFAVQDKIFFPADGLYFLDGSIVRRLPHTETLDLRFTEQLFILPYPGDHLLIATRKKGFYLYDLGMLKLGQDNSLHTGINPPLTILKRLPSEIDQYAANNQLYLSRQISPDRYALCTFNGGIVIMDINGKAVNIVDKLHGLPGNRVHDVFSDKQQNLWVVLNNGISYIELNSPISMFNERNDLEGAIMDLCRFNDLLYAATPHGLFCLRDYQGESRGQIPGFIRVKDIECCCWALTEIHGALLSGGLFGVKRVADTTALSSYYSELVYSFGQTPRFPNHLFLGLRNGLEVLEFNPGGGKDNTALKVIRSVKFKNIDVDIRHIITDAAGNLWLMTQYNGLWYLKYTGSGLQDYKLYRYGAAQGLPRLDWDWVQCLDDKILVCTQIGLFEAKMPGGWNFDPAILHFAPEETFSRLLNIGTLPTGPIALNKNGSFWLRVGETLALVSPGKGGEYSFERDRFRAGKITGVNPQHARRAGRRRRGGGVLPRGRAKRQGRRE